MGDLWVSGGSSDYERALESGWLTVGRGTYGRPTVHLYDGDRFGVTIGSYCSIAEDVEFLPGGSHDVSRVTTYPPIMLGMVGGSAPTLHSGVPRRGIVVGSDVWIGRGAKVLSEVFIGDGAVVGAYSVVASDVRPYAIVAGSPAREIRRRFADTECDALLEAKWWTMPDEAIRTIATSLLSNDVASVLQDVERWRNSTRDGPV